MRTISYKELMKGGGPQGPPRPTPSPSVRNVPQPTPSGFVWPWDAGIPKANSLQWFEAEYPELCVTDYVDAQLLQILKPALEAVYPDLTYEQRLTRMVWRYAMPAIVIARHYAMTQTPLYVRYTGKWEYAYDIVDNKPVVHKHNEHLALMVTILKVANTAGCRVPVPALLAAQCGDAYETESKLLL